MYVLLCSLIKIKLRMGPTFKKQIVKTSGTFDQMPSGNKPHLTNAADIFGCDNRCVFIENGQLYSIITTDIPIKL